MARRKETRQDLAIYIRALSALSAFCCRLFGHLFNVVVGGFDTGKTKEVVQIKILADLVCNFCSFSESKHTEIVSSDSTSVQSL